MNDSRQDEQLLIDFVLGRCDEATTETVRGRLAEDPEFAVLHGNIAATFEALSRYEVPAPADNLVERTMARVLATRRSEALAAAQPARPSVRFPTFSVRELVALAAAVLLVAAIVVPSWVKASRQRDRLLCQSNLGQIGTALNHYASANDGNLPTSPFAAGSWLGGPQQPRASNSAAVFQLAKLALAQPNVFQCPATRDRAFSLRPDMNDFPSPNAISYSYQYSLDGPINREDPQLEAVAQQMVIMVDSTPVFRGGVFHRERVHARVSDNHPDGGQNVLYLDWHVEWVTDCNVGVNGNNIFLAEGIYDYTGRERPVSKTDTFVLPSCAP